MNDPGHFAFRAEPVRLRLTADDFRLLAANGGFAVDGKVELIDGEVFHMNSQQLPHSRIKTRLAMALIDSLRTIGSDLEVLVEISVDVAGDSVPEPDIVLIGPAADRLTAASVALAIEVADSTLRIDRGRKAELYAAAGIPEYWIADVNGRRILIHDQPDRGLYNRMTEVQFGARVTSVTVPDLVVETDMLLF